MRDSRERCKISKKNECILYFKSQSLQCKVLIYWIKKGKILFYVNITQITFSKTPLEPKIWYIIRRFLMDKKISVKPRKNYKTIKVAPSHRFFCFDLGAFMRAGKVFYFYFLGVSVCLCAFIFWTHVRYLLVFVDFEINCSIPSQRKRNNVLPHFLHQAFAGQWILNWNRTRTRIGVTANGTWAPHC
jgi:hypothetical protein